MAGSTGVELPSALLFDVLPVDEFSVNPACGGCPKGRDMSVIGSMRLNLANKRYVWDSRGSFVFQEQTVDVLWGASVLDKATPWRVVTAAYSIPAGGGFFTISTVPTLTSLMGTIGHGKPTAAAPEAATAGGVIALDVCGAEVCRCISGAPFEMLLPECPLWTRSGSIG